MTLFDKEINPPHLETYQLDEKNDLVFISRLCQPSEQNESIRMARFLVQYTKEPIYVLPHIQPTQKDAARLREEYFPKGVKENKNPDYYFRGRFLDGKSMMDIKESDIKTLKRKIQNRLGEAFGQADDAFLEIPTFISTNLLEDAIKGRLNSSNHKHLVYIKLGETFLIFP
ncbi:MAG: hypothetical protein IKR29_03260 [Bacteroidales bacterium]|nr:hypothetical protein [Bacteroidales bacterium]